MFDALCDGGFATVAWGVGWFELASPSNVFTRSGVALVLGIAFTVLMIVAAGSDVRCRRISNSLVLLILALGAVFGTYVGEPPGGILRVLEGAGVGLLLWTPLWAIGAMGAGDVKFFASACAWLGPWLAFDAALVSAVLGGVFSLAWLMRRGKMSRTAPCDVDAGGVLATSESDGMREGNRQANGGTLSLPYGVPMAAGLAITAWFPHLIH